MQNVFTVWQETFEKAKRLHTFAKVLFESGAMISRKGSSPVELSFFRWIVVRNKSLIQELLPEPPKHSTAG
jgi:hypothetical protein